MEFNKRLCSLRMKKGLRQSELARQIGVGKSTISAYESGKTKPSIDIALLIADYFKVSLDYLFGRTEYSKTLTDNDAKARVLIKENNRSELVQSIINLMSEYEITKKF